MLENLSAKLTPDELRTLFEGYGTVEGSEIVTDVNTGYSRGFAFVGMTNDVGAAKAVVTLNGTTVRGSSLKVEETRPRLPRMSSTSM